MTVIDSGSLPGLSYGHDDDPDVRKVESIPVGYEKPLLMYPLDFEDVQPDAMSPPNFRQRSSSDHLSHIIFHKAAILLSLSGSREKTDHCDILNVLSST